ncbi:MAG: Rrf2 family transcriptional regulator [Acetobacteraceae bacterium]|nr:Rrf2 family transcriptional regulator [Acetobacteraceae bacterium]
MRLSTRGRYGVKALFELALHQGEGPLSLKAIARGQGLSEHYLEQLMGLLRNSGLVRSARGPQGGYVLGRDASEITVGDIIRTMEGPIALTDCTAAEPGAVEHCGRAEGCMAHTVWSRVTQRILEVVDSITLADLCRDFRAAGGRS